MGQFCEQRRNTDVACGVDNATSAHYWLIGKRMRIRKTLLICCAACVVAIYAESGIAQQTPPPALQAVESGSYKPLTFWNTVSLGTSYYTNPQRASGITVAYTYDGPEFSEKFKSEALWSLAQQGKISFGLKDTNKNTFNVVPLSELQKKYPINVAFDLMTVLQRDDVIVVANDKTLLGEGSKASVVKTEPSPAAK